MSLIASPSAVRFSERQNSGRGAHLDLAPPPLTEVVLPGRRCTQVRGNKTPKISERRPWRPGSGKPEPVQRPTIST
jgi:hypothetical protein